MMRRMTATRLREQLQQVLHTVADKLKKVTFEMNPTLAIGIVFIGCASNVVFLEELVRIHPKSGNLITFAAFAFNALEGFIFTSKFLTKRPVIPIKYYIAMVTFFFIVQVLNNYVLGMNVSMPLQMIFRSGTLVANLLMGFVILGKRYQWSKYCSVLLITFGIILCTYASASFVNSQPGHTDDPLYDFFIWSLGVCLLILSLLLSAGMGIFQEQTYRKFGKHPAEALFYNHFIPLPGFLLFAADIYNQAVQYNASVPVILPVLNSTVPISWLILLGNTITQYICIRAVFVLTTECSSLTVTLVVTLRKFISLIISVIYFKNPFTIFHCIGAVFVFGGTLMFTEVFSHLGKWKIKRQ